MNNIERVPSKNVSSAVQFLIRGSKKRRTLAMAQARSAQAEQGVSPRLVAVK